MTFRNKSNSYYVTLGENGLLKINMHKSKKIKKNLRTIVAVQRSLLSEIHVIAAHAPLNI